MTAKNARRPVVGQQPNAAVAGPVPPQWNFTGLTVFPAPRKPHLVFGGDENRDLLPFGINGMACCGQPDDPGRLGPLAHRARDYDRPDSIHQRPENR
jgi:hypothetical protein